MTRTKLPGIAACLAALCAAALPARAADADKKLGWSDAAELGYVVTSGNTETSTLGLKNTLARDWEKSRFEIKLGGIRVKTTDQSVFAVGSPADFEVMDGDPTLTAENYYLNGRYDHKITDRFFWFAGAGWDRNRFAGIDSRTTGFGGVGNIWIDAENRKWKTDYAVSGTKERDVVEPDNFDGSFIGARLSSTFLDKFSETGSYGNDTTVDENLNDTSDLRVNMTNWVSLNMSTHLALKVSLQWLYDHQPALKEVDLFAPPGPPTVTVPTQKVVTEVENLDSIFTTALVIKY
jgi:putative salt-induced outer membrane protein